MHGEYRLACRAAEKGMQVSREVSDDYHYMSCQVFRAWALLHLGEWGEALPVIRKGLETAEKNCSQSVIASFQLLMAWLHEQALDFERAREICESVNPHFRKGEFHQCWAGALLGFANLGLERYEAAFNCFSELADQVERKPVIIDRIFYILLHHGLSRYWLERKEFARARHEAGRLRQIAAQLGECTYLALGHRTLAEIALAERDYAKAEAELSHAINSTKDGDTPLAEWRIWQTAARFHAASGRQSDADRDLARSLEILHRMVDSLGHDDPLRRRLLSRLPARATIL
jgi:tetratricopeptide (TPR) repeat protein